MKVELLVVPGCPNRGPAETLSTVALDDVGLTRLTFVTTVIHTQQSAEERRFTGSPTILINGHDPFANTARAPSLSCRLYRTATGLVGLPELSAVRMPSEKPPSRQCQLTSGRARVR